ncbi:MAG: redoxin family protein [Planctomycetia bacterium]|nr:redoxin family protein [Planctomycetia bacterium]
MRLEFEFAWPAAFEGHPPQHVLVVSDGQKIYAKPEGFDNQVAVTTAPAKIEVPALYELPGVGGAMPMGITDRSVALDLLTSAKPLSGFDRKAAKLLDAGRINGQACDRVQFETENGPLTLWIDQQTSVVRRVQHPVRSLLEKLKEDGIKEVELTTELVDATIDPVIPSDRFTWKKDNQEHLVSDFVPPPDQNDAPSKLLGKPLPDFKFVTSSGEKGDSASLTGKVTVIDFWATWCGWCIKGMPGVDEVRQKYAGNDKVRFLAMDIDNPDVPNQKVADKLKEIKVNPQWARMTVNESDDFNKLFDVNGIPAMAIVGPDGHLQVLTVGMDPKVTENLPQKIDALLKGEDLAKKATEAWDVQQREYQRKLASGGTDTKTTTVAIPRAEIAPPLEPKTWTLKPLWVAADVKAPGAMLVLATSGAAPRVLVIDGGNEVAELDLAGKQVARHADLFKGQPPMSFIRTLTDKQGKRSFILGAIGQEQFHVFDAEWKKTLSYPPSGPARIFDVQPADLAGDGVPEICIGCFGAAGVNAVGLDGNRLWHNGTIENVADMTVSAADASGKRRLLCTNQKGTIVPIRSDGQADAPIQLADRAIVHILAADLNGDGKEEYCALAIDGLGKSTVIGLKITETGGEMTWEHPLPEGEPERSVQMLTTARLDPAEPGQWLVAAADGSVQIVSHDGAAIDHFNSGAPLTGLASAVLDGQSVLLVAHPDGLSALAVTRKK